ncbi:hypothetical protein SASPL_144819 [Salvia splendens]|uniref:RNA helicase n=1 Tax=Salvia splendens TaxID=180675 RepID=A0A8X8WG06_SALSN|nr:hypothetical protein SASPL_144819 [Salvia splendens]
MAAAAAGIRYAPEDPGLPKPWMGLVDDKTGYVYYWNPETNITQYEKPVAPGHTSYAPAHKSLISSVQKSPQGHYNANDNDDRYSKASNGLTKAVIPVSYQATRSRPDYSHSDVEVKASVGYGPLAPTGAESIVSAEAYRRRHEISVTGDNVPPPFTSFEATGFASEILREVRYLLQEEPNVVRCAPLGLHVFGAPLLMDQSMWGFLNHPSLAGTSIGRKSVCPLVQHAGFSAPTPIQAQSWPIAVKGLDIVAIAKTGSGKTLGYLVPGFIHLKQWRNNPKLGPTVLVLSPTRELATQIQDEAVKFGRSSRISCTCLYGGAPKGPQLKDIDRGVDVVVATPGRLNDILEMRRISLHQVSYLVLDEADRMLDMGFEPQIRKIVKEVPTRRQTLMYTATWPKEVCRIAAELLVNPVQVNIGNVNELVANKAITQLLFNGDKSQGERDYVLNQFRNGRSPVLVATDVASRGLDIKDIRVVLNYDFPIGVEAYVHRIGRTGRAGATGVAYTFFCEQDAKHASELIKLLEGASQHVPSELRDMASRGGGMGRARRQWGSGPGGRDGGGRGGGGCFGSSQTGQDGGRGVWGMPSSTDRAGGRDRHVSGFSNGYKTNGTGSFHENGVTAPKNRGRSRSCSRSPRKISRWGKGLEAVVVAWRDFHPRAQGSSYGNKDYRN